MPNQSYLITKTSHMPRGLQMWQNDPNFFFAKNLSTGPLLLFSFLVFVTDLAPGH